MHNFNSIDPNSLAHALVEPIELVWDQLKPRINMGKQPKRVKLKKLYPGLRKDIEVGDEFVEQIGEGSYVLDMPNKSAFYIHRDEVEEWDDWWKDITPTYKVLTLEHPETGVELYRWKNGKYGGVEGVFSLRKLLETRNKISFSGNPYKIKTVRRLSDSEVFNIGDTVTYDHDKEPMSPFVIGKFKLHSKGQIAAYGEKGCRYCVITTSNFRKVENPILFTTEDGVQVQEGEKYYVPQEPLMFSGHCLLCTADPDRNYNQDDSKRFWHKHNAENWVKEQKELREPRYSRKDIKEVINQKAKNAYERGSIYDLQSYKQEIYDNFIKALEKV